MPRLYKELTKLNRKKTNTLHTTEKKKQNKTKQSKTHAFLCAGICTCNSP